MTEVFEHLLPRIVPLYFIILMGYIAGRYMEIKADSVSKISIYFLVPIVMFQGVMKTDISIGVALTPIIIWFISTITALIMFKFGRATLKEKTQANIIALSAGTANSGYFGIPVALILFDEKTAGLYITTAMGMTIFQNSVGFYIAARGRYTAKDAFNKLLKLPIIYAFILGMSLNYFSVKIPDYLEKFIIDIRGAYVVMGMLIIGVGIAQVKKFSINLNFTSQIFAARFLVWPLIAFLVYKLDEFTFHILTEANAKALILASIVPIAADTVAFATILKCHPEESATAVLLSCIFALFYVPLMAGLLL